MPKQTAKPQRATQKDIRAFLADYDPPVRQLALKARALVFDTMPEAVEQVDLPARMLAYGFERTYQQLVCVIMPLKAGVNLGFARGAELPDPNKLLTGTGKRARHVKLTHAEQVEQPALRTLLEAAIAATPH